MRSLLPLLVGSAALSAWTVGVAARGTASAQPSTGGNPSRITPDDTWNVVDYFRTLAQPTAKK